MGPSRPSIARERWLNSVFGRKHIAFFRLKILRTATLFFMPVLRSLDDEFYSRAN
jgi:hypothetical protein